MSKVWLAAIGLCIGGFLLLVCGVGGKEPSLSAIGTTLGLILLIVSLNLLKSLT
jgi:hypothetical protein